MSTVFPIRVLPLRVPNYTSSGSVLHGFGIRVRVRSSSDVRLRAPMVDHERRMSLRWQSS